MDEADGAVASLSLDEQIGQTLVAGFPGTTPPPEIIDLIRNEHVGNIILFARNVRDTQQVLDLTTALQEAAHAAGHRSPLLITVDQENGTVRRLGHGATVFPGAMTLGATGSPQLARDVARASGRELRALGLTMNLAPAVDVNNNPANPVIGVRSFGEDPHAVADLAAAAVQGYHDAGVMTCLKHFPGHGDTSVDSHLSLPVVPHAMERLEQVELVPFRAGIAAGTDGVMSAHIYFPAVAGDEELPATVSPAVVSGLLRGQLGFDGVVATDCLEMNAIAETIGTERGAVLALAAGIDLLFVSHRYDRQKGAIAALRAAVADGEIAPEAVARAAGRVLRLKRRYLSWDTLPGGPVPDWVGGDEQRRLARAVYERAVTLVRDDDGLLPLRLDPSERLLVVQVRSGSLTGIEEAGGPAQALAGGVKGHHERTDAVAMPVNPNGEEQAAILGAAEGAAVVVVATLNAHLYPEQAAVVNKLLDAGRRVVGLATRSPYDLLAFPRLGAYVTIYEDTAPALEASVRVLFGEIEARGRLPVSLPGLYEYERVARLAGLNTTPLT